MLKEHMKVINFEVFPWYNEGPKYLMQMLVIKRKK